MSEAATERTYGNWRRRESPGLAGMGLIGTGVLFGGLITAIIAAAFSGVIVAGGVGVITLCALGLVGVKDRDRRTVLARIATRAGWWRATASGSHRYHSGLLGRTPYGRCSLPGLGSRVSLFEAHDSYNRPMAMLHHEGVGHCAVVLTAEPDGASLVDDEQIDTRVAAWGGWLSALADESYLEGVAVTVDSQPDTGERLRREVEERTISEAHPEAALMLREVVAAYPEGSARLRVWVALTFATARRGRDEIARDLGIRVPGLCARLAEAGAGAVAPAAAQRLCEIVRCAYEPAATALIDQAYAAGATPELSWDDVGPVAAKASWDSYQHDNARSITWMVTAPPGGNVHSSILGRLLAPHEEVPRKRITTFYEVLDRGQSAVSAEADKRASDFRVNQQRTPTSRAMMEQRAAHLTAAEEASGAALVDFGMLITATAPDGDMDKPRTAVEHLSRGARLRIRPVYGSQDSAFAMNLPLGIVPGAYLRVPRELRRAL